MVLNTGKITAFPAVSVFICSFLLCHSAVVCHLQNLLHLRCEAVTKLYKIKPLLSVLQTPFYTSPISSLAVFLLCIRRMDALSSQSLYKLYLSLLEGRWMKNSDVRPKFLYKSRNVISISMSFCFCTKDVLICRRLSQGVTFQCLILRQLLPTLNALLLDPEQVCHSILIYHHGQ